MPAQATIIAFDRFVAGETNAYTTGSIYNQDVSNGSAGFTGRWGNANNASTTHIQVEATGLTHSLAVNPNADGNIYIRAQSNNDGRRVTRAFDAATLTAIDETSTLFYSGLFHTAENPDSNAGPVWFGIGTNTNANANPANGVYFTHDGSKGFSLWNNGGFEDLELTPAVDTTYLFVVGIVSVMAWVMERVLRGASAYLNSKPMRSRPRSRSRSSFPPAWSFFQRGPFGPRSEQGSLYL